MKNAGNDFDDLLLFWFLGRLCKAVNTLFGWGWWFLGLLFLLRCHIDTFLLYNNQKKILPHVPQLLFFFKGDFKEAKLFG